MATVIKVGIKATEGRTATAARTAMVVRTVMVTAVVQGVVLQTGTDAGGTGEGRTAIATGELS